MISPGATASPETLDWFRVSSLGPEICKYDNRFFVNVWVGKCPYIGLVDSGFNGNAMVSSNLKDYFISQGYEFNLRNGKAVIADGGTVDLKGALHLPVTLGGRTLMVDAYLMDGLPFQMLIGYGLMSKLGARLDFAQKRIVLPSSKVNEEPEVVESLVIQKVDTNQCVHCCEVPYPEVVPIELEDGTMVYPGVDTEGEVTEANELEWTSQEEEVGVPIYPSELDEFQEFEKYEHPDLDKSRISEFNSFMAGWREKFKGSPGIAKGIEAKVYVEPGQIPIKEKPIRLSYDERLLAQEEIAKLLKEGVIEPSDSFWRANAFFVKKKNGGKRLVVNLKALNAVVKRNSAPLPYMDDVHVVLNKAKFYTTLDLMSGYWQVPVHKDSIEYFTFGVSGVGSYAFKRLAMGFCNSAAIFQSHMENVLRSELFKSVFVYQDDVIIASDSYEQHMKDLERVFTLLLENGLKINWKKCQILKHEIVYLGNIYSKGQVRPDPEKVRAISEFPTPTNVKALRSFLGIAGWMKQFIPNLSDVRAKLDDLLKLDAKWIWTAEHAEAFEKIKEALVSKPVLALPNHEAPFTLYTDASDIAVSGVLLTEREGKLLPCAYGSQKLPKSARLKWTTTEKEGYAVLHFLMKYRHLIRNGFSVNVFSDHSSLLWLANLKNTKGRLARWQVILSSFDIKLNHVKGKANVIADALSRYPINMNNFAIQQQLSQQNSMPNIPEIPNFDNIQDPLFLDLRQKILDFPDSYPSFRVRFPHVFKKVKHPVTGEVEERVVVPNEYRDSILAQFHDDMTSGHRGWFATYCRIADRFVFPKMRSYVKSYVRKCAECAMYKMPTQASAGQMTIRNPTMKPWDLVSTDLVGPLPTSYGYKYISVFVDHCSKWIVAVPIRTATAKAVLKAFKERIVLEWGVPSVLLCDHGSCYTSQEFQQYCASINCKITHSPKNFPAANYCERYNKEVKSCLAMYAKKDHTKWSQNLSYVVFALRTARNQTTGFTPARIMFGRELRSLFEISSAIVHGEVDEYDVLTYDKKLQGDLGKILEYVKYSVKRSMSQQAHRYDLRHRPVRYAVDTLVWKRNYVKSSAIDKFTAGLSEKFVGPFRIKAVHNDQYELENLAGKSIGKWHGSQLKPVAV